MKEGSKRKMVGDGKEERAFLGFIFQATSAIIFFIVLGQRQNAQCLFDLRKALAAAHTGRNHDYPFDSVQIFSPMINKRMLG